MVVYQRPVEAGAGAAGKRLGGRVEQDAVGDAAIFLHPVERARILEANSLPRLDGQALLDRGDPFGGFAAVELDAVGPYGRARLAGQFGPGVDEQERALDRPTPARGLRYGGG